MVHLGFAFNFNIQRCEIEVGDEHQIIDQGYRPLVELFEKYHLKADAFLSGFTSELLRDLAPDLLQKMRDLSGTVFNYGTYTYTHPIPQLLEKEEFVRQMRRGLELDRSILGEETVGFLPPEFAYSEMMGNVLEEEGVEWFIALASQIELGLKNANVTKDPFHPFTVRMANGKSLISIPAVYELPDNPQRFFKLMMKGEVSVDTVIEGIKKFAAQHPNSILLFKRDGETIFIDKFNSGFEGTYDVMDEFLSKISQLDCVTPSFISDTFYLLDKEVEIHLPDYLGNTKLETFTAGAAESIWNDTVEVRNLLLKSEASANTEKAWEHLLLSHNSDGRIGYWFSEWNPGEHLVAPSRRAFIEENLAAAKALLK